MTTLVMDKPRHACHVKNCPEEVRYVVVFTDKVQGQAYVCQTHALTVRSNPLVKEIKEL